MIMSCCVNRYAQGLVLFIMVLFFQDTGMISAEYFMCMPQGSHPFPTAEGHVGLQALVTRPRSCQVGATGPHKFVELH